MQTRRSRVGFKFLVIQERSKNRESLPAYFIQTLLARDRIPFNFTPFSRRAKRARKKMRSRTYACDRVFLLTYRLIEQLSSYKGTSDRSTWDTHLNARLSSFNSSRMTARKTYASCRYSARFRMDEMRISSFQSSSIRALCMSHRIYVYRRVMTTQGRNSGGVNQYPHEKHVLSRM